MEPNCEREKIKGALEEFDNGSLPEGEDEERELGLEPTFNDETEKENKLPADEIPWRDGSRWILSAEGRGFRNSWAPLNFTTPMSSQARSSSGFNISGIRS